MYYPPSKKTVETILRDFVDNIEIFDELLEDFIHFKENLEKRAKMVEKRNTESQQGLERLELSKQKAHDEIKQRLQKANATVSIINLLQKPWTDFLSFNLLRHGESSLAWQSALKVVDGVAWSVNPKESTDSKEDFHRRQHELEQSVTEGLEAIGYDQQASKELLLSLKEAHELSALESMASELKDLLPEIKKMEETTHTLEQEQEQKQAVTQAKVRPPNVRPPNVDEPRAETNSSAHNKNIPPLSNEEKNMLAKLKDIAFGTWFEFKRGKDAIQLKLAWFSRITSHYMFVDQSGIKQKVANQYDLARGMCSGEINIIEISEKSFMERAFEAVLETLKLNN